MSEDDERLAFTITKLGRKVSLSRTSLYEMIKAGTGPRTTSLGHKRVILAEDAHKWLQERRKLTKPLEPVKQLARAR
jgi:predicted DNA-binding transcriptional regulator AlpA